MSSDNFSHGIVVKYRGYLFGYMTKIIATHISNINETSVGIFMGILLRYIVYWHQAITNTWWEMNNIYHDNWQYRMHILVCHYIGILVQYTYLPKVTITWYALSREVHHADPVSTIKMMNNCIAAQFFWTKASDTIFIGDKQQLIVICRHKLLYSSCI